MKMYFAARPRTEKIILTTASVCQRISSCSIATVVASGALRRRVEPPHGHGRWQQHACPRDRYGRSVHVLRAAAPWSTIILEKFFAGPCLQCTHLRSSPSAQPSAPACLSRHCCSEPIPELPNTQPSRSINGKIIPRILEEAGFGCLHPSEVLARKQKHELHRLLLALESPKGWSAGTASMMGAFSRAVQCVLLSVTVGPMEVRN